MIVIKVDSNGNVTTVPAVVHMGESMVEAVIYSDAYHSLCTMRILPPNQEQVEEVICTPIIDDTKKRVSAWKATLPDTITAQSGLCNYQLLFTNLNGKQEVSEQGTFKINGNVPYNAPATVEDFSQYTISDLYALLNTFLATYEGLSQQIAMIGGDFSEIEKISQVVHPALLITPTEIAEITLKPQGSSAWWNFMTVNGGEDSVRLTSTQLDPFLYLAKDGFTISGQVLKISKKFVVKYKTSDTSMTGGSFIFDFTDGSRASKSVEYINDGEWHLLTFDFYDIVPESASSGVLSSIYWEWAYLAVTGGVALDIAYVGFFDGEIIDLIESMISDAPSGGMEIVTIENGKPSMSAKEIYDKFQNGTMVLLSYQTPSGISVLMDLESVSQTTAVFKHTHVEPVSKNATTYTIEVYSTTYTLLTTTQSLEGENGGVALPLSGKNILIFGCDYENYDYFIAEIERITGATVYNFAINETTCQLSLSDSELKQAFSLSGMITQKTFYQNDFSAQENAISNAKSNGIDTTRYEEVLDLLKDFASGEISPDITIFSYAKYAWYRNAEITNESSSSDTSTYIGSFQMAISLFSTKFYATPFLATEHNTPWQGISFFNLTNGNGDKYSSFVDALDNFAEEKDYPFINLSKQSGFQLGANSNFFQGYDSEGFYFAKQKQQEILARIITRHLC